MGESTVLHSIGADFMQVVGPEVFLPTEVIISVSEDGKNFTELSRQTHKVVKSDAVVFKKLRMEWGRPKDDTSAIRLVPEKSLEVGVYRRNRCRITFLTERVKPNVYINK